MTNALIRKELNKNSSKIKQKIKQVIHFYDEIISNEKWIVYENGLQRERLYGKELEGRLGRINEFLHPEMAVQRKSQITD